MDEARDSIPVLYPIPPRVPYPPNLTIIGTINVDETTYAFAPKVLDRAFVLEFTDVHYAAAFGNHPLWEELKPMLLSLHEALHPDTHHFGYRVAGEMLAYLEQAGGSLTPVIADFLLMSKVLPKLRGTEHQLSGTLSRMQGVCDQLGAVRSRAKVDRMAEQLRKSGFASYF